jgi:Zn-dependent peptidase ImmA (M78 family)
MMTTAEQIARLLVETGETDDRDAIRMRSRELIALYVAMFGEPPMPMNVDVLASLRGIHRSEEMPAHSPDAELVPDGIGGVKMRVNPYRPETRQRFSVAHEIAHTFFPEYTTKAWCRTDARFRDRENPAERLEWLCDVAAAELLFPLPWFASDAANVTCAADLLQLASTYRASPEATLRRYAETSPLPLAAAFFHWKLKPSQKGTVGNKAQQNFLGISPEDEIRDALRLRIDYSVSSESFRAAGHYLPKDKSIENAGPLFRTAATAEPADDECSLDLGQASGKYRVWALPLWTPDDQLGPNGENGVAAILQPLEMNRPKKSRTADGPSLFD